MWTYIFDTRTHFPFLLLVHSLIHYFIQQIFLTGLLCDRHCARRWGYSHEQNAEFAFTEFIKSCGQKVKSFWEDFLVVEPCKSRPDKWEEDWRQCLLWIGLEVRGEVGLHRHCVEEGGLWTYSGLITVFISETKTVCYYWVNQKVHSGFFR